MLRFRKSANVSPSSLLPSVVVLLKIESDAGMEDGGNNIAGIMEGPKKPAPEPGIFNGSGIARCVYFRVWDFLFQIQEKGYVGCLRYVGCLNQI